jgi:hypothetical protein
MGELRDEEALAIWAKGALPLKNGLTEDDAKAVEAAYLAKLAREVPNSPNLPTLEAPPAVSQPGPVASDLVTPLAKPIRKRSKAHLIFVASHPCLVCKGGACDAHHVKTAQPRSLGRKVSDEFTVPLCRKHHQQLHRHGNERAWWQNQGIDPLPVAAALWQKSHPVSAAPMVTAHDLDEPGNSDKNNLENLPRAPLTRSRLQNSETKPILRPEAG